MAIIFKGNQVAGVGKPGKTGESAYEIALKNGYEGSEEQFAQELNDAANVKNYLEEHNVSEIAHQDIRDLIDDVEEELTKKSDVGHTHTAAEVGARPNTWMPTVADIGAYTKEQVMTAATAAAFGFGASAVPDDVLAFLGKYNKHWWTKREYTPQSFTLGEVISGSSMSIGNSFTYSCSYSDTIEVGHNGTVKLAGNVTTESFTGVSQAQKIFDSIKGKYFKTNVTNYTYIAYRTQTSAITGSGTIAVPHQKVTGQPSVIGAMLSYEISNEPDTFPVNDAVDSVWYTYLGVPFENAVTAPKIVTGSYTGTGTNSASTPVTLTFDFSPKFILIAPDSYMAYGDSNVHSEKYYVQIWMPGITKTLFYKFNGNSARYTSVSGNTFSFYEIISGNGGNIGTLNASGKTYYYIAFGC